MRMRKKKNGAARIEACRDLLIENTAALAENPQFAFDVERPLYIEIGCGKGNFACGMSAKNPDRNFIAMERVADVACLALEKAHTILLHCCLFVNTLIIKASFDQSKDA